MKGRAFYDRYWTGNAPPQGDPTTGKRLVKLRRTLDRLKGDRDPGRFRILDAGCGNGEFVGALRRLGYRADGVELSEVAANLTRAANPEALIRTASLEDPSPFAEETFDAVWCTEVLEHLFDIHAALAELNRVLKTGGALILTTPYHGLIKNLLVAFAAFDRHFHPALSHIRFFSRRTLGQCLVRAGFAPYYWSGIGRMWPVWKSFFVVARKVSTPGPPPPIQG